MSGSGARVRGILVAAFAIGFGCVPALTQVRGQLSALTRLEPGLWQIRTSSNHGAPVQSICVGDPAILMQVQHRNSPCSRLVIANDASGATVHYTCPSSGYGRTTLRVETSRLARIDTQGIVDNAPFAWRAEARRIGPCAKS
jgi:hypothetical protein